jgi:hypothetical protein
MQAVVAASAAPKHTCPCRLPHKRACDASRRPAPPLSSPPPDHNEIARSLSPRVPAPGAPRHVLGPRQPRGRERKASRTPGDAPLAGSLAHQPDSHSLPRFLPFATADAAGLCLCVSIAVAASTGHDAKAEAIAETADGYHGLGTGPCRHTAP